jgi:hypothetical protein
MNKIVVLNYETGEVFVRNIPEDMEEEDWWDSNFNDVGLKESNCHYMVVAQIKIDIK